ncbi:hypothetical protein V1525DRAFT_411059 [Lipomyces kononenkoae]|uniref:Uncharacterized protein n=1 Tax=Lipomyces kononenkoae TaxID=34357 RepID=A0ACC3STX4_LIPKO
MLTRQRDEQAIRKADLGTSSAGKILTTPFTNSLMEHSQLLEIVKRPLSPDTRLEIPASQTEYERVQEIIETEDANYPQLWYDSARQVAIVVAVPSPLHSRMAGQLMDSILREVRSGFSSDITSGLSLSTETTSVSNTLYGLTRRGSDGALIYLEGSRETLMIAVEVGVSQSYQSLRAAISWSVLTLHCRVGLAMSISEGDRGASPPVRYFASKEEAETAVDGAEQAFRDQLIQHPYGPLERNGYIWFGRIRRVILETYRFPDDDRPYETLLSPSSSFIIVEDGEFIGDGISPNLRQLVIGDCIPSHILTGRVAHTTPVNFFRREWFEDAFKNAMVKSAVLRVRLKTQVNARH